MLLKPSEIRFSQEKVRNTFKDDTRHGGEYIGETLDDLCEGRCDVSDIPKIYVKWMGDRGYWVTADNRRLWVFQQFERLGGCSEIQVLKTNKIDSRKMSSCNRGASISIRGSFPGGSWYSKPSGCLQHDSTRSAFGFVGTQPSTQYKPPSFATASTSVGSARRSPSGLFGEYNRSNPNTRTSAPNYGERLSSQFGSMSIGYGSASRVNTESDDNSDGEIYDKRTNSQAHINDGATQERLLVAAIDFGTTFSGYAFSFRSQFLKDPTQVMTNKWSSGSDMGLSLKTSTCVLFDPQQRFHSFGFEAEDKYAKLADDEDHVDWYYFKRFKMLLYENQNLSRYTMIKEVNGKQMRAMTVFSESIRFLKGHFLKSCTERQYAQAEVETTWVLTVPAIWNDSAKQFMRESAKMAGIDPSHLSLALEPEAASMFCKHVPISSTQTGEITCFKPGTRYMVFDAGGGTVDITVHETQENGTVRELYKANGGPWGGTCVDEAFITFLTEISSKETLDQFKMTSMADYLDMMREFEVKKAMTSPDLDHRITFKIPVSFQETYARIHGHDLRVSNIANLYLKQHISMTGDKLRVHPGVVRGFFSKPCEEIVNHLEDLFSHGEVRNTNTILMVGGFSESKMLQDAVKRNFPDKEVVIPPEPGLAVLKGAVIFGHNPAAITSRVSRLTYGVEACHTFDPQIDPLDKLIEIDGRQYCDNVFDIHVKAGDEVKDGVSFEKRSYTPIPSTNTNMCLQIYTSDKKLPSFIDEDGCRKLGSIRVDFGNLVQKSDKSVKVCMKYGGTELHVEAHVVKTGQKAHATFDFL